MAKRKTLTAPNNGVMIRIQNLTKHYEKILAVNNLSFDVGHGEVLGLLGSNGAGKTTTLHIIAGLLKPTFGEVFVNGERLGVLWKHPHIRGSTVRRR